MSFVDGQLADFRGGRVGFPGDRNRVVPGNASYTARYTLAAGAMTSGAAVGLTIAAGTVDQIGTLSGGNTWTPNDKSARYLIHVHLQTTVGNAQPLIASLQNSAGTVLMNTGEAGTTGPLNLVLTADGVDWSTVANIQVWALSTATLGLVGGGAPVDGNFMQIVKLAVQ